MTNHNEILNAWKVLVIEKLTEFDTEGYVVFESDERSMLVVFRSYNRYDSIDRRRFVAYEITNFDTLSDAVRSIEHNSEERIQYVSNTPIE